QPEVGLVVALRVQVLAQQADAATDVQQRQCGAVDPRRHGRVDRVAGQLAAHIATLQAALIEPGDALPGVTVHARPACRRCGQPSKLAGTVRGCVAGRPRAYRAQRWPTAAPWSSAMSWFAPLRQLDVIQRHTVAASFLGWTLDAFDFFLLVFVLGDIADDFHVHKTEVTLGILLTLAARPLGALLFGRLADRYGRRPVLMFDVLLFLLLVLRFAFGIAMGGEWGIGASLALESIPARSRGMVSGLLQSGYPCGYFL